MNAPYRVLFAGRLLDLPGVRVRVYAAPGRPPVVVVSRRADRRPGSLSALVAAAVELAPALGEHLVLRVGAGLDWIEPAPGADGRYVALHFGPGRRGRRVAYPRPSCRQLDQAAVEALLGRELAPTW